MQSIVKGGCAYLLLTVSMLGLSGCSTLSGEPQRTAKPATENEPVSPEGRLLSELDDVAPGADIVLSGEVRVVADKIYTAASGRTCRRVRFSYPSGNVIQRLGCEYDGSWRWAPAITLDLTD